MFSTHLIYFQCMYSLLFFIFFKEMKAMLYLAVEQAPSAELVEPSVLRAYFSQFDEKFFHYCDKELTKINTFFSGKFLFCLLSEALYLCCSTVTEGQ